MNEQRSHTTTSSVVRVKAWGYTLDLTRPVFCPDGTIAGYHAEPWFVYALPDEEGVAK